MTIVESTNHPEIVFKHARSYIGASRIYRDKIKLSKGKDSIYIEGDNEVLLTEFALLVRGMRHSVYMMKELD